MCDIMYMPQKNQSARGTERSKHDYCNSFINEAIIKLCISLESYKFLIDQGILAFIYIYIYKYIYIYIIYIHIRNIKTKIRIQEQYHYSITVYQDLPST